MIFLSGISGLSSGQWFSCVSWMIGRAWGVASTVSVGHWTVL